MSSFLFNLLIHHPIAIILTIGLIVVAVLSIAFGWKFQIGGFLSKIWGSLLDKIKGKQTPNLTAVPVENRKNEDGTVVPPGKSDDKGWTQAPVDVEIKDPGVFSDPNVLEIVHPDKGVVKIELPEGVKNTDVKEVIVISPTVIEMKRNDNGVNTSELLKILSK